MPRPKKTETAAKAAKAAKAEPKPHTRNLRQLRITILPEDEEMVKELAEEIRRPGLEPNLSEAVRVIFAEWRAGRRKKARVATVKRGRRPDGEAHGDGKGTP